MEQGLIRVRDFAANCGCTPQNIYGHLRTYSRELEGHIVQGKGRQGQLLDVYAQDFLRSIMYPKQISTDTELMDELNALRGEFLRLGAKHAELAAKLAQIEGERDRALLDASQFQKALTASQEEQEAKAAELQQASEALEKMRDEAFQRLQEANAAEQRELEAQKRAELAEAELAAYKALPWYKKLRRG